MDNMSDKGGEGQDNAIAALFDVDSRLHHEICNLTPYKVIGLYSSGMIRPASEAIYLIDADWLFERISDILSTITPSNFSNFVKEIYKKDMGMSYTQDEKLSLARYRALNEAKEDFGSLIKRLQLMGGIEKAASKGVSAGNIKEQVINLEEAIKLFDKEVPILEVSQAQEADSKENRNGPEEQQIETAPPGVFSPEDIACMPQLIPEPLERSLADRIQEFYACLGIKAGKVTAGAFKYDAYLLLDILEGIMGPTLRLELPNIVLANARETFLRVKGSSSYMTKRLLMGLGLSDDQKAQEEVQNIIGENEELRTIYRDYRERLRYAQRLNDFEDKLSSASESHYFVLHSELEPPIFLMKIAKVRELSPEQIAAIAEQIKSRKESYSKEINKHYSSYIGDEEVRDAVGRNLGAFLDMPEIYHLRVGESSPAAQHEENTDKVSLLRNHLLDPNLGTLLMDAPAFAELLKALEKNPRFSEAKALIKEGGLDVERALEMDPDVKFTLSETPASKLYSKGTEKQENGRMTVSGLFTELLTDDVLGRIIANNPELEELLGTGNGNGVEAAQIADKKGKTPIRMVYEDALKSFDSLKPDDRFVRWMIAYKKLKCLLYPEFDNYCQSQIRDGTFRKLEGKIIRLTGGVHPDSLMYQEEKEFFQKKYAADTLIYSYNKRNFETRAARGSMLRLADSAYNSLRDKVKRMSDGRAEDASTYLAGITDITKRIAAEREIMAFVSGTITEHLNKDATANILFQRSSMKDDGLLNEYVFDKFAYFLAVCQTAIDSLTLDVFRLRNGDYSSGGTSGGELSDTLTSSSQKIQDAANKWNCLSAAYDTMKFEITKNTVDYPPKKDLGTVSP